MSNDTVQVLLIEDSKSDALIITHTLAEIDSPTFEVTVAGTLQEGLELQAQRYFDAIVLDLQLPDSDNPDTLKRVRDRVPETPIVVLTRSVDESFGIEAMRQGAQDFVPKSDLRSRLLARSLSFSIERAAVMNSMRQELRWLEALYTFSIDSSREEVQPSTRFLGMIDIESSKLESQYVDLLEGNLEDMQGGEGKAGSELYFKLASEFGKRDASPKDLANMHARILKRLEEQSPNGAGRDYIDSGRQVLLNLMGYLADYYRRNVIRNHSPNGKSSKSKTDSSRNS